MLISDDYLRQNRTLHETQPSYGIAGHKHAYKVGILCLQHGVSNVLDYGCGKGTLKTELMYMLPSVTVVNYDPATYPALPDPADLLVCTDVLEHIEPECLENVLEHMASLGKIAYMTISTHPARKALPDGRNAHLIQEDQAWWKPRISKHWDIEEWNVSQDEIECIAKCG